MEVLSSVRLRAASRSEIVKAVLDLIFTRERAACRSSSVRGWRLVWAVGDVVGTVLFCFE